jgi:hypothetical protein
MQIQNPKLSIIMPCSPIISHPSTEIIEESIRRIRAYPELKDVEILICCDGIRAEQEHYRENYEEYKRRLIDLCKFDSDFKGCLPIIFQEHYHQVKMLTEALKMVKTPLIFFVEADTFPIREIDFSSIINSFEDPRVNYIRLSIFDHILGEHSHLYFGELESIQGCPLLKTSQFSARPNIARKEWYEKLIEEYFDGDCICFVEDIIDPQAQISIRDSTKPFDYWGMYLYHPDTKDITRSATNNGRGSESKYFQRFPNKVDK